MKPVTVSPAMKLPQPENSVTEIKSENPVENESLAEKSLLDTIRNTYISESSDVFSEQSVFGQIPTVTPEKLLIIDDIVKQFLCLTDAERLLLFLRLPIASKVLSSSSYESKLGVLTSRVEIRRTSAWIRSHLQADNDSSIPKRDVYDKYKEYCQASRMAPISIADFGKLMKQMYPTVRPRRLGTRGKSQYCYAGMTSCQDLKRPDIYEDCCPTFMDGQNCQYSLGSTPHNNTCSAHFYPQTPTLKEECIGDPAERDNFAFVSYEKNNSDMKWMSANFASAEEISETSDRKVKLRKPMNCKRGRPKRLVQQRSVDFSVCDHSTDGQVEDEVAQYFQADTFCRPLKLVKSTSARSSLEKPFYRSLSYNACFESRSQTSAGVYSPATSTNFESPVNGLRSLSMDVYSTPHRSATEAAEQLAQLQLRSSLSRASADSCSNSTCNTQHFGFTPIAPSPVPQRHSLPQTENMPFEEIRPRSFSEAKWTLKRGFQNAFQKSPVLVNNVWDEKFEVKPSEQESSRSQSLPSFKDKLAQEVLAYDSQQNYSNEPMTCEELTQILENSMAVESNAFSDNEKIDDSFLPQLDNLLNDIKPSIDELTANLEQPNSLDFAPMETTEENSEIYKQHFGDFF